MQGVAETLRERIKAGLRRSVDEVRATGTVTRDAGQDDERAVALLTESGRHPQTHTDRTGVVDGRDLDGSIRVGFILDLVAEHTEGQQHDVDITAVECPVDDIRMEGGVGSVEVRDFDTHDPGSGQRRRRLIEARGGATGQHDTAEPATWKGEHRRDRDLAAPAEDEYALGFAECIHHRDSLLARSEVNTPFGSIASRCRCHSARRG